MTDVNLDPTAGERARSLAESSDTPVPVTDPTAGERARRIHELGEDPLKTDPTDPRPWPR
jgi:hypothetical protein